MAPVQNGLCSKWPLSKMASDQTTINFQYFVLLQVSNNLSLILTASMQLFFVCVFDIQNTFCGGQKYACTSWVGYTGVS